MDGGDSSRELIIVGGGEGLDARGQYILLTYLVQSHFVNARQSKEVHEYC